MISKNDIGSKSLEIANYWTSNGFLREANDNSGVLVAFDWKEDGDRYYLTEINTNIDLGELESENFKFDELIDFLKKNNFTFILGLRNMAHKDNPSEEWMDKLKVGLTSDNIDYDEYITDRYPSPIPEFDVPDNIFILRYAFDPNNEVDEFAANKQSFIKFMEEKEWKKDCWFEVFEQKIRIIVLCSNVDNVVLSDSFER